jgi:hypothetical protein
MSNLDKLSTKSFKYYMDPAHGWIAVKVADLKSLGLCSSDFSKYSYVKGKTAYLEEDLDGTIFRAAYHANLGKYPTLVEKYTHGRSPIRSYPSLDENVYWSAPYYPESGRAVMEIRARFKV